MAIRNTEFFEVLLPDAMQKYGLAQIAWHTRKEGRHVKLDAGRRGNA